MGVLENAYVYVHPYRTNTYSMCVCGGGGFTHIVKIISQITMIICNIEHSRMLHPVQLRWHRTNGRVFWRKWEEHPDSRFTGTVSHLTSDVKNNIVVNEKSYVALHVNLLTSSQLKLWSLRPQRITFTQRKRSIKGVYQKTTSAHYKSLVSRSTKGI